MSSRKAVYCVFFFVNDTATTEIYTLSLHDALPICVLREKFLDLRGRPQERLLGPQAVLDRKSTRLNSSHTVISYAVFCLNKKRVSGSRSSTTISRSRGRCARPNSNSTDPRVLTIRLIFFLRMRRPPRSTLFPYTTLFR